MPHARPQPPRPLTASEQQIRDRLNTPRPTRGRGLMGIPEVEPAPPFRPDPVVVGDLELQMAVRDMLRLAPELRGRVREVRSGPTEESVRAHAVLGVEPLGYWGSGSGRVSVQPGHGSSAREILAHELGHAQGFSHDSGVPEELERLAMQAVMERSRR